MYNEKLEKLIEMTLIDGVITEKEREVLLKRAQEMGIDKDEFEIVLEAKLVEKQKQGAATQKKDNVIKCPSCNDIIPALSRVCPSCEYVLDSRKQSSGSEKGLEDLINDIEENLVEIKSHPPKNIFSSVISNSHITLSLLTVFVLTIGVKMQLPVVNFVAIVLAIFSIRLINKRLKSSSKDNKSADLSKQKALFEKHTRTANTLFGDNKKARLLLNELKTELEKVEAARTKNKKIEIITYGLFIFLTVAVFFIPSKKTDDQLIHEAEKFIENKQWEKVELVEKEIEDDYSVVLLKSKVQLAKLSDQLDALEPLLNNNEYDKVKLQLQKIVWNQISNTWTTENDFFKKFIRKKEAINDKLPKEYKIEVEKTL